MKTFKQHITERYNQMATIIAMLEQDKFQYSMDLKSYLADKSYIEEIGEGFYSTVLGGTKGQEVLVKITRQSDPASWDYLSSCYKGELAGNALAPRVYYMHNFNDRGGLAAFLEPLKVDTDENFDWLRRNGVKMRNLRYGHYYSGKFKEAFAKAGIPAEDTQKWIDVVGDMLEKNDYNMDLHIGNFGFRKNGQLVLFDPIAS